MFNDKTAGMVGQDAKDASQWRELLECVMREMPQRFNRDDGNAPGHAHRKPGIWDSDNGVKAGTECAWCKVWNAARTTLAAQQAQASAKDRYLEASADLDAATDNFYGQDSTKGEKE